MLGIKVGRKKAEISDVKSKLPPMGHLLGRITDPA
jgi:hypothetical protein